ncbi:MAG: acetamidase/formamidase family protein [Acidimicrobiia bacterium]
MPLGFRDLAPISSTATASPAVHTLRATAETCYWGYIDRDQPPCLVVDDGDIVGIETVTHHAGDAPDLLMDDGVRALWDAIGEDRRGPGVHILTGPIEVRGAEPGDTLCVRIIEMSPRLPYGSNCAAHWGLLYDTFGKERITIYGLDTAGVEPAEFSPVARPLFGFDFTARPLYDLPGVISAPDESARQRFGRDVAVPVRPHFGVMGVAPADAGRHSSIPPGFFGGNVDQWRLGPGTTMCYPVFVPGANLYVGDPHFAQGDGEICGTAIEASLNATIQVSIRKGFGATTPFLETPTHWFTHGFGASLDEAMRGAGEQMLWFMEHHLGLSADEAYSLASVAVDLGVTQVVDGVLGCHAGFDRSIVQ